MTKNTFAFYLATGFGSGLLKPAPGTWGTLPGVVLSALVMPYPIVHAVLIIFLFFIGIWSANITSSRFGKHDDGRIVIDEIVGVMLTLWLFDPTWLTLGLGFVWFRIFDILKPYPIKLIDEKVSGGFGVMFDDVLAGVFAWFSLRLSLWAMGY